MTPSARTLATMFVVSAAFVALSTTAEAKQVRITVTSAGTGTDSDKSAAMDQAKQSAEASLICTGELEDVRTNSTGCAKIPGDTPEYVCTAVSRATCVIGN